MLVALGVILVVAGAILTWGIDAAVDGANLETIGYIVMAGGAIALLAAAIRGAGWMSMGSTRIKSERHVTADGNHIVEETRAG